jgi:hypothetical protein
MPCAAWGKRMSRLFAFMHSLIFEHEIGPVELPVFDNKSLKADNLLIIMQNKIWLKVNHSKRSATITARSDFFHGLSTKLSTAFVDNRERDYQTIS